MKEKKYYHDYCAGCGLCCEVTDNSVMKIEDDGFYYPEDYNEEVLKVCRRVCPVNGRELDDMSKSEIWGEYKGKYLGWSTDSEIRYMASSGGVLTALCKYILENDLADGILQFAESEENVTLGKLYCTTDPNDLIKRCGSRYCSSMTFSGIRKYLEDDKRYVFVGKPCDVRILHNYLKDNEKLKDKFVYKLSFFCAGAPSEKANLSLLKKLNCPDKSGCTKLRYRGSGWPGYSTAWSEEGETGRLDYRSSWRDTLGRDIRKICRFCVDGVGELADVACGDAWYLLPDGEPDCSEHEGRNFIFSRNERGDELVKAASEAGYIKTEGEASLEKLRQAQKYQFMRKAAMKHRLFGLKAAFRKTPSYPKGFFDEFDKMIDSNKKLHIFYGTWKRVLQGKI